MPRKNKEAFPLPIDNSYPMLLIQANDMMNELYATKLAGNDAFLCGMWNLQAHCIHFLIKKLYHGKGGRAYLMPYGSGDKLTRQYQLIYWHLFECIERIFSAGILAPQNGHTTLSVWYLALIEGMHFGCGESGGELSKTQLLRSWQRENKRFKDLSLSSPFSKFSDVTFSGHLDQIFREYAEMNDSFRRKYFDFVTAREKVSSLLRGTDNYIISHENYLPPNSRKPRSNKKFFKKGCTSESLV